MTRQTVIAWRSRYQAGGIDALADLPRSGRPPVIDEAAVIVSTLNPPPAELAVTHWSARLLAEHLSKAGMPVSFAEVARIWRAWDLQPHRVETFKFSTDPQLEAKIRDVVGLYLDPPANAVVVCVDEKSQIQASGCLKRWCTAAKRSRIPLSATSSAGSRNTPRPSSPRSSSACPTPASKASTPRSG